MSDPPLSDIDLKKKMALVWTTLKLHIHFLTRSCRKNAEPVCPVAPNNANLISYNFFILLKFFSSKYGFYNFVILLCCKLFCIRLFSVSRLFWHETKT